MANTVFTIGHSTHPQWHFLDLLRKHSVEAICDVRSRAFSRFNPQFNRDELKEWLEADGVRYVFLGRELGARSEDRDCYRDGRVRYERLAATALFQQGLDRVEEGARKFRLALMCAEKEPMECHRTILISRHLAARGIDVAHILEDGSAEPHEATLTRLLRLHHLPDEDMFHSRKDFVTEACQLQEERIAWETAAVGEAVER